jgi:hypothetical protein
MTLDELVEALAIDAVGISNVARGHTPVRVLSPSSEVLEIVALEFEPDEQSGSDVLWLRTELAE